MGESWRSIALMGSADGNAVATLRCTRDWSWWTGRWLLDQICSKGPAPTADGRLFVVDEVDGALLHSVDIGALASDGVHVGAGFLLAAFGDGYVRATKKTRLI